MLLPAESSERISEGSDRPAGGVLDQGRRTERRTDERQLAAGYDESRGIDDSDGPARSFLHLYHDTLKYPARHIQMPQLSICIALQHCPDQWN